MPKKGQRKRYNNFSSVYAPTPLGHEQIWDDSELIDQFDEALREWKEERLETGQAQEGYDTDPETVPDIGPWVEVPVEKYNPDNALESNAFPSINDLELLELYDQALKDWSEEREPENWKNHLMSIANAAVESDNSARLGPWVVVDDESHYHTGNSSDSQDIPHDLDVVSVYDEALKEWKDERCPDQTKNKNLEPATVANPDDSSASSVQVQA